MRVLTTAYLVLITTAVMSTAWGQSKNAIRIKNLMTAAQFESCGLSKLSPKELSQLDRWLEAYSVRLAKTLSSAAATSDVVESHIESEFNGWEGETLFKLDNGQIWQQSSYSYRYHYAYRPKVLIFKTGGGYKMKVEGVEETIDVRRIK